MKLKIWSKLILWLGCILCLAIGAVLIASAVGNVAVLNVESVLGYAVPDQKWVDIALLAAGIVLVLFALYAMSIPGKLRYKKRSFVVQTTESGDLRIAIKAIEGLVKRCVDMHEEISLSSMRILSRKTGVVVELRIALNGNISIPLAVASLQKQIKQYLLASSGIEVNHVSVTVDTTKMGSVKKAAPLADAEVAEEAGEGKKEKKPMHQRIFASKTENTAPKAEAKPEEKMTVAEEKAEEAAPVQEETVQEAPAAETVTEEIPAEKKAEPAAEAEVQEENQHE